MGLRDLTVTVLTALLFTVAIFAELPISVAQVMQSTNYRIESDSVNFGGGLSTSTSYRIESTAGEVATGDLSGATFNLRAGYQQMVNTFISMTSPAGVTMSPSIVGITGGTANGSTTVTVTTDSSAGYQMTIVASVSPALRNGSDTIADYVPIGADPDYTFSINADEAFFGYSPSGVDTVSRFKDDGASLCNTGSSETALACWDGLNTASETIVQRASANTPAGSTTTVHFRVGIGGSVNQTAGVYIATTTLTAISL